MKHVIATILMVFAFFSLSNAQHKQDYAKVLSNPEAFRNILLDNIEYFKEYCYDRGYDRWHASYDYIGVGDSIYSATKDKVIANTIDVDIESYRIVKAVTLSRDRYTHIESDGTIRHLYSNYDLYVEFRIDDKYRFEVSCETSKNDSTIVNCKLIKNESMTYVNKHKFLRSFKMNYSVILEVLSEIKKLDNAWQKLED